MTKKENTIIEIIAWVVLLAAIIIYILLSGVSKETIKNPEESWKITLGFLDLFILIGTIILSIEEKYKMARRDGSSVSESIVESINSDRDNSSQKEPIDRKIKIPQFLNKNLKEKGSKEKGSERKGVRSLLFLVKEKRDLTPFLSRSFLSGVIKKGREKFSPFFFYEKNDPTETPKWNTVKNPKNPP